MKVEPVAWIGQDAFAALSGGETVCQTMTPRQAMYDDVPLCVMPPAGYALVPVEQVKDAERYAWLRDNGRCNEKNGNGALVNGDNPLRRIVAFRYWCYPEGLDSAIDAAITAAAKGE